VPNTSKIGSDSREELLIPAAGPEFFSSLIGQLAKSVVADCAWVAAVIPGTPTCMRALAVLSGGKESANFDFTIAGTPAEAVFRKSSPCLFPSGVRKQFPSDPVLRSFDINAYAGITLLTAANEPLGLIAVACRGSFPNTRLTLSLLRRFAAQAAAELERIRAAESLRASEARLKLIFENAPDAFLLLTLDGKLLEANRSAEELTGYAREEMIGRSVLVPGILPEEDLRKATSRMAMRAAGSPPSQEEFAIIHRSGRRIVGETFSHLTSIDGAPVMLLCIRDITARKATQLEKQRHDDRVRELQSATLGLARHEAVVTGDLNRTAALVTETVCRLGQVSGVAVWLFASENKETYCLCHYDASSERHAPQHAGRTGTSGDTELLDYQIGLRGRAAGFLRIEQARGGSFGQMPEEKQFIASISGMLTQSLLNAERARAEESLRRSEARLNRTQRIAALGSWERDLATDRMEWSDEVFRIYGVDIENFVPTRRFFLDRVHPSDISRIETAIDVLLRTGEGCQVAFRIIRPDGTERYVRELAEVERNASGNPVRLIGSVQDITDLRDPRESFHAPHRVENLGRPAGIQVDEGDLLTIPNPLSDEIVRGDETVLVVEDHAEVRALACTVLESLGYCVLSAQNAGSALRLSMECPGPIHLLLAGMVLPGMAGDELADRLRTVRPGIKVLFMSGFAVDPDIERSEVAKGAAFMQKPFDPLVLAGSIRELLGSASADRKLLLQKP
jgi:PAS domain S-box-containing protein